MSKLTENYDKVKHKIEALASKYNRQSGEVKLLAVSKTFPIDDIKELYEHGVKFFGESRAQELEEKSTALPDDIKWHFIGRLQSNKSRNVIQHADTIHSVNSSQLLARIDRIAGEENRHPEILLQCNITGEKSKTGVCENELAQLTKEALECKNIKLIGYMTMAKEGSTDEEIESTFAHLSDLRDRMEKEFNCNLPELSIGMSGDYELAIKNGSTIVRIGTAIFGNRDYE